MPMRLKINSHVKTDQENFSSSEMHSKIKRLKSRAAATPNNPTFAMMNFVGISPDRNVLDWWMIDRCWNVKPNLQSPEIRNKSVQLPPLSVASIEYVCPRTQFIIVIDGDGMRTALKLIDPNIFRRWTRSNDCCWLISPVMWPPVKRRRSVFLSHVPPLSKHPFPAL